MLCMIIIENPNFSIPQTRSHPVPLLFSSFSGPLSDRTYDTAGEESSFSVACVGETVRELVGTWRYGLLYAMTVTFQPPSQLSDHHWPAGTRGSLAGLSAKFDHMREGYPTTFLTARTVFTGFVDERRSLSLSTSLRR
jgi:hypothetical protein